MRKRKCWIYPKFEEISKDFSRNLWFSETRRCFQSFAVHYPILGSNKMVSSIPCYPSLLSTSEHLFQPSDLTYIRSWSTSRSKQIWNTNFPENIPKRLNNRSHVSNTLYVETSIGSYFETVDWSGRLDMIKNARYIYTVWSCLLYEFGQLWSIFSILVRLISVAVVSLCLTLHKIHSGFLLKQHFRHSFKDARSSQFLLE